MGIINIPRKEIEKSKPIDGGDYLFNITRIGSEKASKDGQSINQRITLTVADGPFQGREITHNVNNKPGAAFFNANLFASASGFKDNSDLLEAGEEDVNLSLEALEGKQLGATIIEDVYEGKPQNKVKIFYPVD